MKIVYMGTPDFAVPALEALCGGGQNVVLAVTQPDKAKDRGKKIQFTPVKESALRHGIPVLQPEKVKQNEEFFAQLRECDPDLIVVAAYGKILPKEVLGIPQLGCINIHASLLPKYRGAAPIHRAVINGEEVTGVTLMYMAEGLDTGDMIAKAETPILKKNTKMLHEELAELGARLLLYTLPSIEAGSNRREQQREEDATYAPMVFKQDGVLDFSKSPGELECLIRGFNSWPVASTVYQGTAVKVWEAETPGECTDAANGTVVAVSRAGVDVAAAGKILRLTKLQFPGKKAMKVEDYIRGNKIEVGSVLG